VTRLVTERGNYSLGFALVTSSANDRVFLPVGSPAMAFGCRRRGGDAEVGFVDELAVVGSRARSLSATGCVGLDSPSDCVFATKFRCRPLWLSPTDFRRTWFAIRRRSFCCKFSEVPCGDRVGHDFFWHL